VLSLVLSNQNLKIQLLDLLISSTLL